MAGKSIPAGTIVEVIPADDERVQEIWPGIQAKVKSVAVAVQFSHLDFPTFVHINQIELIP